MIDLDTAWSLWQRGLIPAALMVLFHIGNGYLIARWAWVAAALPWLANKRWLAIASSLQGATAGLVPLAIAGDLTMETFAGALLIACAQFLRPSPAVVP